MVALVSGHPHPLKRKPDFDPANPCRYFVESPSFRDRFANISEQRLFKAVVSYSGAQHGGVLGRDDIVLADRNDAGSYAAIRRLLMKIFRRANRRANLRTTRRSSH